jgi:hypothetical protein
LAELGVLVVGVLIALAVDRWIATLDVRNLQEAYVERLIENVRTDSTAFEAQIARAEEKLEWASDLSSAIAGELPSEDNAGQFLRRLDRLPAWTPTRVNRDAWDDLVATGNVSVIRSTELRQLISAYYNGADRQAGTFDDMDAQLTAIEMSTWPVLDPRRRLDVVQRGADASLEEVQEALDRLRGDRVLHARLVQAELIHRVIATNSRRRVAQASDLLDTLQRLRR